MGGVSKVGPSMRHEHLVSFFAEHSKCLTLPKCLSVKISLAAPKILYLDTYRTFFNALSYTHSVKGVNQYSGRTGTISSAVLKLSSSYTDPFGLSEFSRLG